MRAHPTQDLPDVLILEPDVHGDDRGYFMETYNARVFGRLTGFLAPFVQDNHSRSTKGVLRGLHYQIGAHAQGKLVRCTTGEIFDVAVDLRRGSPSFGRWAGVRLSAENRLQLWVPAGFAHGFLVLSESADVIYKVTQHHDPAGERAIRWDDPDIGIEWPTTSQPTLSPKDAAAGTLSQAELFA